MERENGPRDAPFDPPLRVVGARNAPICSIGDWLCLAPPAGRAKQWRSGRSARELAAAWLRPGRPALPEEVAVLLVSQPATTGFAAGLAVAEARLRLDEHAGATRNADLLLLGTAKGGRTLITIEAKADEPFGRYVSEELASVSGKDKTNLPDRIARLTKLIFGTRADLGDIRYQLLHGLAATVLEAQAQGADQAVFVIHEFRSAATDPVKRHTNHQDLADFVRPLGVTSLRTGSLVHIPVDAASTLRVLLGVTVTDTTGSAQAGAMAEELFPEVTVVGGGPGPLPDAPPPPGFEAVRVGDVVHDAVGRQYTVLQLLPGGLRIDHDEFGVQDWGWHALLTLGGHPTDDPDPGANEAPTTS